MITVEIWILLIITGLVSFFAGLLKFENRDAAISYFFSVLFLFISAIVSPNVKYVTDSGVVTANNSLIGLLMIPIALIASVLALTELVGESVEQAGVNP